MQVSVADSNGRTRVLMWGAGILNFHPSDDMLVYAAGVYCPDP
jgi:hypothetical protein